MIYDWLKTQIPHPVYLKKRNNDNILIVCTQNLSIYYFNATAALFLSEVNGVNTVDKIKMDFLKKYDVPMEVVENDLIDLVRDLQWKEIITLEG